MTEDLGRVGWDWCCPLCKTIFNDSRMTKPAALLHLQACRNHSESDREVFRRTHRWPRGKK